MAPYEPEVNKSGGGMPDIPLGKVLCPDCRGEEGRDCRVCDGEGFVDAVEEGQ